MKFLQLVFLILINHVVFSQNQQGGHSIFYDQCNPCSGMIPTVGFQMPNTVYSDFGPRSIGGYDWHGGIDYNDAILADFGFRIRAGSAGTVKAIGESSNVIYIVIDGPDFDYGYLHIFNNSMPPITVNGFKYVDVEPANLGLKGILTPGPIAPILLVACPNGNCLSPQQISYTENGQTYLAQCTILLDQLIAPLGISGATNAHLHLSQYSSLTNCGWVGDDACALNPFEFIEYYSPDYDITIHNNSNTSVNNPANVPVGFTDTDVDYGMVGQNFVATEIMVRANHPNGGNGNHYTSATFDIDKAVVKVKSELWNSYSTIHGPTFESRISFGGRLGQDLEYPTYINSGNNNNQGWWDRQGIFPFAYRDSGDPHGAPYVTQGGRPYDDYFFTDFVTRIHKNDPGGRHLNTNQEETEYAYCPENCRYIDGEYQMIAEITTIRNQVQTGPEVNNVLTPNKFIIDNWKPYIKKVEVRMGLETIYYANWDCSQDNCIKFNPNQISNSVLPFPPNNVIIDVTSSEPLNFITLVIPNWNGTYFATTHIVSGEMVYRFEVSSANFINSFNSIVNMHFYGFDRSWNQLLGFTNSMDLNCYQIPFRGANGFENPEGGNIPSGFDILHALQIRSCETNPPATAGLGFLNYDLNVNTEVAGTFSANCEDGAINISISSGISPYTVQWQEKIGAQFVNFGNSITSGGNDGSEDLTNLPVGVYKVIVTDEFCGTSEVIIPVEVDESIVSIVNYQNNTICDEVHGRIIAPGDGFINTEISYAGLVTMQWHGPDGFISTSNFDISGLCPGIYTLIVRKASDPFCSILKEVEICCCEIGDPVRSTRAICPPLPPLFVCEGNNTPNFGIGPAIWSPPTESNSCDGYIYPHIQGSDDPTLFVWDLPDGTHSNSEFLENICLAGEYCLSISNGCVAYQECWILPDCFTNPIKINSEISPYCGSYAKGFIELNVLGGTGPYLYTWTNFISSTNTAYNLDPGNYCVTITDENNCKKSECYTVPQVSSTSFSVSGTVIPGAPGQGAIDLEVVGIGIGTYEWSNGEATEDIDHLDNGNYFVTVTNSDGCSVVRNFNLTNLICDTGGDLFLNLGSSSSNGDCSGEGLMHIIGFGGSVPPYTLTLTKENTDTSPGDFTLTQTFSSSQGIFNIPNLPKGRYNVRLQNGCLDQEVSKIYDMCEYCGWTYNVEEKRLELWDGKIWVEFKCPCDNLCGFWPFYTEPHLKFIKGDNYGWFGLPYIVTFPDNNSTSIQHEYSGWEYTDTEPDRKYYLTEAQEDGTPFTITMKHEDCEEEITVIWNSQTSGAAVFHCDCLSYNCNNEDFGAWCDDGNEVLSNGKYICDYYWANYKCDVCTPLGSIYSTDPCSCDDDPDYNPSPVTFFEFVPFDDDNPCEGGGYMTGWIVENNDVILEAQIEIPSGIPFSEVSDDWIGALSDEEDCEEGGGCIFNSLDIPDFNISLDKLILAQYCLSGIVGSEDDCDGDDVPNDEDPCDCDPFNTCVDEEDEDDGDPDGGPSYDPENGCLEDFDPYACIWIQECEGEDPVVINGTVSFESYSGYYGPDGCWYCFEAEVCRVETPDETFIYVYDFENYLSITIYGWPCDPEFPNSCGYEIICELPAEPPTILDEGCNPTCNLGGDECFNYSEIVEDYIEMAYTKPITFHNIEIDKERVYKIIASYYDSSAVVFTKEEGIVIKKNNVIVIEDFKIYPNPSNGLVILESNTNEDGEFNVALYNNFGQNISTILYNPSVEKNKQLDYSHLTNGIYFIFVMKDNLVMYETRIVIAK